jgi:UDP:flavonoid glycosyltransferase YjiC (YdhE family)
VTVGSPAPERALNILVTTSPILSHLWDVVPTAWALRSRGHDVRVASLPNLTNHVVETSLTAMPVGRRLDPSELPVAAFTEGGSLATAFAQANARMSGLLASGLLEAVEDFRPDLVLHEPVELAGRLVADRLGVPAVHQSWGPPVRPRLRRALAEGESRLRARFGMTEPARPPALVLDVCPPAFQTPDLRIDAPHQSMRYVPYNGPGAMPDWLAEPRKGPRVCVTMGTVLPENGGLAIVGRIARALAPLGMEVVVPLRPAHRELVDLDLPGVRVVDWLPLKLLADSLDVLVHQGGPGTALTALGFGVPQLALPVFGDEHTNAMLLERCGAGRKLDHASMTDEDVVAAVRDLLEDPSYRQRAQDVAAQIAAQPSPSHAAEALEDLVRAWNR